MAVPFCVLPAAPDGDVVEWSQAQGRGYRSLMDRLLRLHGGEERMGEVDRFAMPKVRLLILP